MAEITLTGFTELMYQARNIVASEPSAFLNSVVVNSNGIEKVSLGGTVTSFNVPQPTLNAAMTPAMTIPEGDAQTLTTDTMTIGQVANIQIPLKGEIWKQIENTAGWNKVRDDMFAQALRTLRNAIEAHVGSVLALGASRGYGAATTTPFASNLTELNGLRQILFENGCPFDGQVSCVINPIAGTNLRNLSNLQKVNEAGDSTLLRKGVIGEVSGFLLKESAQVAAHTTGSAANATLDGSAYAVGATALTLANAGTGDIAAGDILAFANDTLNKYVVKTGCTGVASDSIVLNLPGLRKATGSVARAITSTASFTANVGFHKSACELVMRAPAVPPMGDAAKDRQTLYDEKSGLVFEVALYGGYYKALLDITCYYQAKVWNPHLAAILIG